ncbi:MAG: tocopherol cyclase family protein [Bacteroidota bacterium]
MSTSNLTAAIRNQESDITTPSWQLSSYPWLRNRIRAAFQPNNFHGWGKRRNYFEGWYCKLVVPEQNLAYAFIPGISLEADGSGHAFIQVLDGVRRQVAYHRFALSDFQPAQDRFELQLANNYFSDRELRIDLPGVQAKINYLNPQPWAKRLLASGVMGWYGYVPGMECYHGMVSAHHHLQGYLEDDRGRLSVDGGVGYLEKDWGSSFPAAWIWLQSNHLELDAPASLMASVARIPWRGAHFRGFLCTWLWEGQLHTFTTWNRSSHQVKFGEGFVDLYFRRSARLTGSNHSLTIRAYPAAGGQLISPTPAGMVGKINESLQATLELCYEKNGQLIYEGNAHWAGLEVSETATRLLGDG